VTLKLAETLDIPDIALQDILQQYSPLRFIIFIA